MSLKCQFCGEEYDYDGKICHSCEETAITNGLASQDGNYHKWRCDNFIELNGLVFGSNLNKRKEKRLQLIECPECGEKYSYGTSDSDTIKSMVEEIPHGEKLENKDYDWNIFSNIKINERKLNNFLKFE